MWRSAAELMRAAAHHAWPGCRGDCPRCSRRIVYHEALQGPILPKGRGCPHLQRTGRLQCTPQHLTVCTMGTYSLSHLQQKEQSTIRQSRHKLWQEMGFPWAASLASKDCHYSGTGCRTWRWRSCCTCSCSCCICSEVRRCNGSCEGG